MKTAMILRAKGEKNAYFVVDWTINDQPVTKTVSTRGEVYRLVRALLEIGIQDFRIQRIISVELVPTKNSPLQDAD